MEFESQIIILPLRKTGLERQGVCTGCPSISICQGGYEGRPLISTDDTISPEQLLDWAIQHTKCAPTLLNPQEGVILRADD